MEKIMIIKSQNELFAKALTLAVIQLGLHMNLYGRKFIKINQ
jgi:hypothetical protein